MKKIYTLLLLLIAGTSYAQVEGVWYLAEQPGALAVGPNIGDGSWWSNGSQILPRELVYGMTVLFFLPMEILQMEWEQIPGSSHGKE